MSTYLKLIAVTFAAIFAAASAMAQQEYRVKPGDVLAIEVLEDESLNRTVQVLPDGRFNFPLAGTLPAAGRNSGQIEALISGAIQSNFATAPTVFVSIQPKEVLPTNGLLPPTPEETIAIFFVGEVNRPGTANALPGTTFLQAIAVGGGLTRFAATKRIQLRRTDPTTGVLNVYTLNYKALANGAVGRDIELKDGDVILVPERRLFE